jgi:hypothetical protein
MLMMPLDMVLPVEHHRSIYWLLAEAEVEEEVTMVEPGVRTLQRWVGVVEAAVVMAPPLVLLEVLLEMTLRRLTKQEVPRFTHHMEQPEVEAALVRLGTTADRTTYLMSARSLRVVRVEAVR